MKTRNIICMALTLLVSVTAMAKGSSRWHINAAKNEKYKVCTIQLQDPEAFDQISLSVAGDLEYTQSTDGTSGVTLIISENIIDKVETTVAHGRLSIEYKKGIKNVLTSDAQIKIIAHSPSLSAVKVNGSGDMTLKGSICTEELTLHINGSGDINAHNLTCQSVNVNINGSGDVNLAGTAKEAFLKINGSGDIDCERLLCQQVKANINGSGDIDCYASETLTAHVNGSGEIDCSGSPRKSTYKK